MGTNFASGKHALAECDICGFRCQLFELKPLVIKLKVTNILACLECWNEDQPQLQVGMWPVVDPQAIRNPRPDHRTDVSNNPVMTGEYTINGIPIFTTYVTPDTDTLSITGERPSIRRA